MTLPEHAAQTMTDDALIELAEEYQERLSYFAAAEGNWSQETNARNRCEAEAVPIRAEMQRRGLQCKRATLVSMD